MCKSTCQKHLQQFPSDSSNPKTDHIYSSSLLDVQLGTCQSWLTFFSLTWSLLVALPPVLWLERTDPPVRFPAPAMGVCLGSGERTE